MVVLRKIGGKLTALLADGRGVLFGSNNNIGSGAMSVLAALPVFSILLWMFALVGVMMALHGGLHPAQLLAFPIGATAAQPQKKAPFRYGTRQRRAKVGVIAYATASAGTPLPLPRVGLLSAIVLQFRGTVTLSGAGALSDQGPWNILTRIKVNANIGGVAIVDVSGYGAYLMQKWIQRGWISDNAGAGSVTANADLYGAPVAMGANTWTLTWVVPISANRGMNFETGLINLQAPEVTVTVEPTFGALLDPSTLVTATTGNLHVWYEYYEIPDPRRYTLPPLVLVRTLEEQQAVGQTGDNIYTVPRMGTLLNLIHRVTLNGARSDSIDSIAIRFNKTDTVYNDERQELRMWERIIYALPPAVGVFFRDFWNSYDDVSQGDTRDAIDSEQLTTLESIVTVSSGATLGSNNNFLASIRRIVQVLD